MGSVFTRGSFFRTNYPELLDAWRLMVRRCYNKKDKDYRNYGARGIGVDSWWYEEDGDKNVYVYRFIFWSLLNGWAKGLELDRRENGLSYSQENCRWITRAENQRNKRNLNWITAWGETKLASEWARDSRCTISHKALLARIRKGITPEDAISKKSGLLDQQFKSKVIPLFKSGKTRQEIADIFGVEYHCISDLIRRYLRSEDKCES